MIQFWNNDVLDNIEGVLQIILNAIETPPAPNPAPPQERGEGRHC